MRFATDQRRQSINLPMKMTIAILALVLLASPVEAKPHWYTSKQFWGTLAVEASAMTADYSSSQRGFARGGVEANPIFGSSRPGAAHMVAIGLPIDFGFAMAGYRMSQSRFRAVRLLSFAPAAYATERHIQSTIHNEEWNPPASKSRFRP